MLSNDEIGTISELAVAKKAMSRGFRVSLPLSDYPYDLVIESDDEIHRVQVKRGYDDDRKDGYFKVNVTGANTGSSDRKYSEDNVDAFTLYDPNNDSIYWLWFDETPSTQVNRKYESMQEHLFDRKV